MNKVLMLDMNNLMYRTIFFVHKEYKENFESLENNVIDLWQMYKCSLLSSLKEYIVNFKPTTFIVSIDFGTWRKKLYSKYKDGRQKTRDESPIDFKKLHEITNEFISQLKEILPNIKFIQVENCESDDIVAVLCKEKFQNDEVVIISTDQDHKQLMTNKNIKIWNPNYKVRDFMTTDNPANDLNLKVVYGDSSDVIPNILVMEGVSFEGTTIGCGEKTAEKVLEEGITSKYVIDKVKKKYPSLTEDYIIDEVKKNYNRNLNLISFDKIPEDIKMKILNFYDSYEKKEYSSKNFLNYLYKYNYQDVVNSFQLLNQFLFDIK